MSRLAKISIVLLRMCMGGFILFDGLKKAFGSSWSMVSSIKDAVFFSSFYHFLATNTASGMASFLITWSLVLIGFLLIIGVLVRIAAFLGMIIMLFFYSALIHFPYVGNGYFVIDPNLLYALILFFLFAIRAGEYFGVGTSFKLSRY